MSTKAQINANRLNAKKSTGPKSAEGKEKVAKNAQKHGIFAQKDVITGENHADYDMLRMELLEELEPIGPTENILAERIVSLTWRLMRTERIQNLTLDSMLEKYQHMLDTCYYTSQRESQELILGHVARGDFADTRILDRLMMYERRLEGSLLKIRKELREQQKRRLAERERQKKEVNQRDSELKNWTVYRGDKEYEEIWKTDDGRNLKEDVSHGQQVCCDNTEKAQNKAKYDGSTQNTEYRTQEVKNVKQSQITRDA